MLPHRLRVFSLAAPGNKIINSSPAYLITISVCRTAFLIISETCFKTFIKANKAKVSISGRYIEFQYTGKTYRIVLGSEFRTASNEGEDDGYHLTYQLIGWPRHWPVQHVADFYNEVSAYSPHKIGCDCGCLGWGITTPIDLYPKIVRVISERKEEA